MMNQPPSRPRQAARYLLLLPLAGLLALAGCDRQIEQLQAPAGAQVAAAEKFILDGQPSTEAAVNALDVDDIARMEVINDQQLLKQFGQPTPRYVAVVVTKPNVAAPAVEAFDRRFQLGAYSPGHGKEVKLGDFAPDKLAQALVFVDGQASTKAALDQIDPKTIAYMLVCDGPKATPAFGPAGAHGVIVVVTQSNAQSAAVRAFEQHYHLEKSKGGAQADDVAKPTGALYPSFMRTDKC